MHVHLFYSKVVYDSGFRDFFISVDRTVNRKPFHELKRKVAISIGITHAGHTPALVSKYKCENHMKDDKALPKNAKHVAFTTGVSR